MLFLLVLISCWLFLPAVVRGDAGHIGVLHADQRQALVARDSLEGQRYDIIAEAEALSTYIDSLKGAQGEVEPLHEALRASLGLVQRLVVLDRALETARAREDSLLEQLRLGYDWEIGVLIQQLQEQTDEGLLTQLMVYQEAREALGARSFRTSLHYDEGMTIGSEDGPEEIRQKLELMENLARRLERDAHNVSDCLHQLEEEYRLRVRLHSFTSEMRLFTKRGQGQEGIDSAHLISKIKSVEVSVAPVLLRGREVPRQELVAGLGGVSSDDVLLEIHKWKARLQEIRQLEAVAHERTVVFRRYLQEMLEGPE